MKTICCVLLWLLLAVLDLRGALYYAAPSATGGDGSIGNPWNLNFALTNTAALDGGTLYLRDGSYKGNFVSVLNNAVVRSYPNEWAVVSDGNFGRLALDIDATTNRAIFQDNGNYWSVAQQIYIGNELIQLNSIQGYPTNWGIVRHLGISIAAPHASNDLVLLKGPIIAHYGTNTTFRDFEITSLQSTNRNIQSTNAQWWLGSALNLLAPGIGNKAINLIIHDTGHPGIGFWNQGAGGEVNGCIIWGTLAYDYDVSFGGGVGIPTGSAIYAQNQYGMAFVKNCINFRNGTTGGKVYGETGPVLNFGFYSNIVFQNNELTLSGSSGSTSSSNIWFNGNVMLGTPMLSYVSTYNRAQYFINNLVVQGAFKTSAHNDSVYTNNTVFITTGQAATDSRIAYSSLQQTRANLSNIWDRNTYYLGAGTSPYSFDFSVVGVNSINSIGGGVLRWIDGTNGYTNWSEYDVNSTYADAWPTNYQTIKVFPNDYDPNRWHIAVVNTIDTNTAWLDLSTLGFQNGQTYELRRAEQWSVIYTNGTYAGGPLGLPLTLTNFSALQGSVTNFTDQSVNAINPGLFNAFVLKSGPTPPPGMIMRVNNLRIR